MALSVEPARSGRSGCKSCRDKIQHGTLRIGRENNDEYHSTSWYHLTCYSLKSTDNLGGFDRLSSAEKDEVIAQVGNKAKRERPVPDQSMFSSGSSESKVSNSALKKTKISTTTIGINEDEEPYEHGGHMANKKTET